MVWIFEHFKSNLMPRGVATDGEESTTQRESCFSLFRRYKACKHGAPHGAVVSLPNHLLRYASPSSDPTAPKYPSCVRKSAFACPLLQYSVANASPRLAMSFEFRKFPTKII